MPYPHWQGPILQNCLFPFLTDFAGICSVDDAFLTKHPNIKSFGAVIWPRTEVTFHATHLPVLEDVIGPLDLLTEIVPGRPITRAKIIWVAGDEFSDEEDEDTDMESVSNMDGLRQSSASHGIELLENIFIDWPSVQIVGDFSRLTYLYGLLITVENGDDDTYTRVESLSLSFLRRFIFIPDCSPVPR
jgi:hypothetical protein